MRKSVVSSADGPDSFGLQIVGEVIPQNVHEVVFTIVLMVASMTVYQWTIGEISSMIMSADMHLVSACLANTLSSDGPETRERMALTCAVTHDVPSTRRQVRRREEYSVLTNFIHANKLPPHIGSEIVHNFNASQNIATKAQVRQRMRAIRTV